MNAWIGHTNQTLYFTRLLIDQAEQGQGVSAQASEQGALCLLQESWLSYLNELSVNAGHKVQVGSLAGLIQSVPLVTGEITEIRNLAEQPASWVAAMQTALTEQRRPQAAKAVQQSAPGLIAMQATDSLPLRKWWQAMSDLIDSQRENRQET